MLIKLSEFAMLHFFQMFGYENEYGLIQVYTEGGEEDSDDEFDVLSVKKKNERKSGLIQTCSNCLFECEDETMFHQCHVCEMTKCIYCCSWKKETCGLWNCNNLIEHQSFTHNTQCGLVNGYPHIHQCDTHEDSCDIYCDCSTCNSKYQHDRDDICLSGEKCCVSFIMRAIQLDQNVECFFDGGCRCSPWCGCIASDVLFTGENANLNQQLWKKQFDIALKKWQSRYKVDY